MTTCQFIDGTRVELNSHFRDCNTSGCPGCKPCVPEHGHCTRCRHVHLDATHPRVCPTCVGRARRSILDLVDQALEAHLQYVLSSTNSAAFMVAGPAADYEAHSYVHQSATSGRLCKCAQRGMACPSEQPAIAGPACEKCPHHTCRAIRRPPICPDAAFILEQNRTDDLHPLTVLSDWALTWSRHLDHDLLDPREETRPWVRGLTIATASHYLLTNLTYMAQQEDADFADFARSINDAGTWLEQVLRTGARPEKGAPCPSCGKANLEHVHTDTEQGTDLDELVCVATGCGRPAGQHPTALCSRDRLRVITDNLDWWVCPNAECAQAWTEDEYRAKVDGTYVHVADRLPASLIREHFRVPEATVRSWALRGRVAKRGRDAAGRQLYDVADVLSCRDRESVTRTTA
ncbi:hypothetical protein [Nocardioides campestrisoli]|uniref:hypothetical protein n=1 Tax=Nocardioides campestrisoli TaxID=2736757 RepID=UPI0015E73A7B|nr:hypothetical protein [Nocardioides campestrisoli]